MTMIISGTDYVLYLMLKGSKVNLNIIYNIRIKRDKLLSVLLASASLVFNGYFYGIYLLCRSTPDIRSALSLSAADASA